MRRSFSLAVALLLGGCTHAPRDIVPPPVAKEAAAVSCAADPAISYRQAKPGEQDDRGNAFDTPETIAEIVKHNAVRKAVCP